MATHACSKRQLTKIHVEFQFLLETGPNSNCIEPIGIAIGCMQHFENLLEHLAHLTILIICLFATLGIT